MEGLNGAEHYDGTNGRDVPEPECWSPGELPVSVPRGLRSSHRDQRRKLVLHVDLNNTILVSDAVRNQGPEAALDYYLSTVTWGRMSGAGKWEWLSDSPSLLPPCHDAVSYYSQFGRIPAFTSTAGRRFRKFLDQHLDLFRWPDGTKGDRELSVKGEAGGLYHWILPSFFQLLRDLVQEGRDFAVIFRTFGSDLPRLLSAISRVLSEGAHPLFPDLPDLKMFLYYNFDARMDTSRFVAEQRHQVAYSLFPPRSSRGVVPATNRPGSVLEPSERLLACRFKVIFAKIVA